MIHYFPYLTHNTMNKNFDRLALLHKISYTAEFKNNASFISTESQQQMLPNYEDLIKSLVLVSKLLLVALAQYFSKSSSFSTVCRKPV